MSETTPESSPAAEPPREWVEALLEREEFVRDFLDSLAQARMSGEHEEVRERLRGFAESQPLVFEAVKRAVGDDETFITELRKQFNEDGEALEEALSTVDEFGTKYEAFRTEMDIVWMEQAYGLWNPQPEMYSVTKYNDGLSMPTLEFTLSSGDTPLTTAEMPASQSLALAEILLRRSTELLHHALENDDQVDPTEQRSVADSTRQLTDGINQLQSVMGRYLNDAGLVFEEVDDPDWDELAGERNGYSGDDVGPDFGSGTDDDDSNGD